MQCIIKSRELGNEMTVQLTIYKAFTFLLTDNSWRHWQKFNGVFLGTVLMWDRICVYGVWTKGGENVSGCLLRGNQERGWTRAHVRSRYADFQAFTSQMRNIMKQKRTLAVPASCLWILAAKRKKRQDVNDKNGNNRKTLGEPLWTVRGFLIDTTGAVVRGGKAKGETERGEKYTETERGSGKERASYSSLCSLNEVFFLFFCVCVVALSVDDGCVGIRCIVRPFGLVCQVCSWGSEKQTCIRENKCQAWCSLPEVNSTSEDNIANAT